MTESTSGLEVLALLSSSRSGSYSSGFECGEVSSQKDLLPRGLTFFMVFHTDSPCSVNSKLR